MRIDSDKHVGTHSGLNGAAVPSSDAQQRLMGIIASATDAIITVDGQQRITLFNAAAERMFRFPATEAIGTLLDRFIPIRFREIHREHIRAFGVTGVTARSMGPRRPLVALRADGEEFPVEATISQVTINGQRLFTAIIRDISERRRAEEALRESEARLRAVVETAVDGIITIDERGRVTSMNPAAVRIFGYSTEEVMGRNVAMLMPEPFRSEHDEYMQNYLHTGVKRIIGIGREVTGQRKDGSTFPLDLAVSETVLGHRRIFTGIIRDISDRKRLERAVLDATAAEQRRIAHDLHDGLCQHLLATSLSAEVLARRMAKSSPSEASDVAQIAEQLRESIGQARALSHGLNPIDARRGGLFASLQELTDRIAAQCEINCVLERDGEPPEVDPAIALHLYRITQEAISNAIRHGKADHITVELSELNGHAVLRIRDNGIGIAAAPTGHGIGLHTMAHRANVIGGRLDVRARAKRGTEVTCAIPLPPKS